MYKVFDRLDFSVYYSACSTNLNQNQNHKENHHGTQKPT